MQKQLDAPSDLGELDKWGDDSMKTMFIAGAIATLTGCPIFVHAAPAVYKCAGADGSAVFSPQPCGKNAKEVDTTGALRTGTSPNLQGVSDRASLAAIDGRCAGRERAINDQATRAIGEAESEMARLGYADGANDIAKATRESGMRAQYSAAADRKATAMRSQRSELSELRKECDKDRADEMKEQRAREAKAAAASP